MLDNVAPPERRRLINLVDALTEAELARAYRAIIKDDELLLGGFLSGFNLLVYACQEDFPFNSREGATNFNAGVRYPFLVDPDDLVAPETIYASCEAFTPNLPRADFHTPVASDLPVMVLSGLADTQTSWRWGPLATETLSNAQSFVFPGAGHGALLFSDCARDMTVTFIHAPEQPVPDGCIHDLVPTFVLPNDRMPD
ncbi:alpha/beta hydrolase [Roseovarius aquimarinus]|uniref:Alpha/beta hydrolase n=1 Tax=Roseovarius aquimarinus TaxID=1229156 RepID=A0ABW7I3A8_9RHOB